VIDRSDLPNLIGLLYHVTDDDFSAARVLYVQLFEEQFQEKVEAYFIS
jgi:hypothetical protein